MYNNENGLQFTKYYMLSDWQTQIIIGTVLAGSSLTCPKNGVNYHLCMRNQEPLWLSYKMVELEKIFPPGTCMVKNEASYCARSLSSPHLNVIQSAIFAGGRRKITEELLDPLRDIALMVWFMDGGGKTGRNLLNAYINTTKFGTHGGDLIRDYFQSIDCFGNIAHYNGRSRLLFSIDGTRQLFRIIDPLVPSFMRHRL